MHVNNKGFILSYCAGFMLYVGLCFFSELSRSFYVFFVCVFFLNVAWIFSAYYTGKGQFASPFVIKQFTIPVLLLLAIVFRIPSLFVEPLFEDDHYRYLWEGFLSAEGFNPYLVAPADFFDVNLSPKISAVLDGVSYPEYISVYGAAAQAVFSFAYWLSPGEIWPLKLIVFGAEVIILYVLYYRVTPQSFVLFAFCPLLIHAMSINMHVDVIALTFVCVAFKSWEGKRVIICGLLLGLACSIKIYAVIILPLFLFPAVLSRRNLCGRNNWLPGLYVFGGACLSYFMIEMPFLMAGTSSVTSAIATGENWAFNNPLYYAVHLFIGNPNTALCFMLGFIAAYTWVFFKPWSLALRALGCFTALLIFSPVVNAWYFAWVLLFAAYRGVGYWPWIAAVTLWLSYCSGVNLPASELSLYEIPWWLMLIEWLLPLLAFICGRLAWGRAFRFSLGGSNDLSLSLSRASEKGSSGGSSKVQGGLV